MVSDVAHQPDSDSSVAEVYDRKIASSYSSRSNDDKNSRKNDRYMLPLSNASKTFRVSNRLNSTGSTGKKQRIGDMSPLGSSHSSSDASPQDLSHKRERFGKFLDHVLSTVITTVISTSSSPQQIYEQSQQSVSGVAKEVESSHSTNDIFNPRNPFANNDGQILQTLIQEKQTECLVLQQKIDSQNSEIAQLQTIVGDLRGSRKQQTGDIRHLQIAMKRVSDNAASARDEANKAEARGAALMSHVDAFETIVQETKRTSVLLLQEQEDIGMGVEGMEKEFVKVQAELARNSATKQKMQQENRKLSQELRYMKCRIDEVIDNLELEQSESLLMKRKYEELEITVQVQQSRSKRLQEDLDSTQALLLDSTSASTESKIALQDCKQAFDRMEEANRHLHQQLKEHQAALQKQDASHQEELNRTKMEHQQAQLQLNSEKDRFRALEVEKLVAEKRQESQTAKLVALERRLKESTNLMTTTAAICSTQQHTTENTSTNNCNRKEDVGVHDFQSSNEKHSPTEVGAFVIPRLDGKEYPRMLSMKKQCSTTMKKKVLPTF